jgi:AcrR family transcriptional regulator
MPKPRTRAEQKDATRARFIHVARRVFVRHGYDATSIAMVCREARVTHGALYHHFPSKDALFAAVVSEAFVDVARAVRAAVAQHEGWQEIEAACHAYLEACADGDVQVLLFRDGPRVLAREAFDSIDHAVNAPLVDGLIERWIGSGLLAPRPVTLLARTLGAAFAEAGLLIHEGGGAPHVRAQVTLLLELWIGSLRRPVQGDARPHIPTNRLVLSPWAASDEAAIARLTSEPEVYRYLFNGRAPDRAWIRTATGESNAAFDAGAVGMWLAREGENVVGFAGFVPGEGAARDLVVATVPSATRRGYAREMAQAVLREASARRCLRVSATVDEANVASIRLMDALGFVAIGTRTGPLGRVRVLTRPYIEAPLESPGASSGGA